MMIEISDSAAPYTSADKVRVLKPMNFRPAETNMYLECLRGDTPRP